MSKSRGNVVDPWEVIADPRRRRLPLVLPDRPSSPGPATASRSRRSASRSASSSSPSGTPTPSGSSTPTPRTSAQLDFRSLPETVRRPRPLGALAPAGDVATVRERMDDFDCTAAGRAIAEYVEELSNWYVRLSRRRFWDGDRAAFATLRHCLLETVGAAGPVHPLPRRRDPPQPRRRRPRRDSATLQDSVHLRDFPRSTRRSPTPSWRRGWRRCG